MFLKVSSSSREAKIDLENLSSSRTSSIVSYQGNAATRTNDGHMVEVASLTRIEEWDVALCVSFGKDRYCNLHLEGS